MEFATHLVFAFVCAVQFFYVECATIRTGTVYINDNAVIYTPNKVDRQNGVAYGSYNRSLLQTGWNVLDIGGGYQATKNTDVNILYASGFIEGALTFDDIQNHYTNVRQFFTKQGLSDKPLRTFLEEQYKWAEVMVTKNPNDPFWRHVGLIIAQTNGLMDGYNHVATEKWDIYPFLYLNGVGDLLDLKQVLNPKFLAAWEKMSHKEKIKYASRHPMPCSALIKVTGAYENLFMSHSSWFIYQATLRIYKHYDFNVADPATSAKRISFSSYPGFLESLDDFYLLSSKMVMLQTTNDIFNKTLYKLVVPSSLPAWIRVRVANMMANNGSAWASAVKRYNSGTYNNQYMIIDLKKIHLKKSIDDNALWVVEQIPGLVRAADQSKILRAGYWPSYNVPFYEDIFNISGYRDFANSSGGLDWTYQLAPRAKIFRRDQANVTSLKALQKIMRYNDYMNDPYSDKNPCSVICCRNDLNKEGPRAEGCFDTKVTSYSLALNMSSYAINGPTRGNDQSSLPVFTWDKAPFSEDSHQGLPPQYNFDFVFMHPVNFTAK